MTHECIRWWKDVEMLLYEKTWFQPHTLDTRIPWILLFFMQTKEMKNSIVEIECIIYHRYYKSYIFLGEWTNVHSFVIHIIYTWKMCGAIKRNWIKFLPVSSNDNCLQNILHVFLFPAETPRPWSRRWRNRWNTVFFPYLLKPRSIVVLKYVKNNNVT